MTKLLGTKETDKEVKKSVVKHERTLFDVSECAMELEKDDKKKVHRKKDEYSNFNCSK